MNVQELLAEVTNAPVVKRAITNHATLNEAYDYGSAFSRGMRIDLNGVSILLISGTASIDERGNTVHVGDFRAQQKARPGMTSSARPATCATSSAITRPSTRSGQRSSTNKGSPLFRRPLVFRRSYAVPIF
jgi:hypothetical protein